MKELETKVLNVNKLKLSKLFKKLGAKKILNDLLFVDWFQKPGTKPGAEPWFLRARTGRKGGTFITLKFSVKKHRLHRHCEEIELPASGHTEAVDFLSAMGLERYAHQEKRRTSWLYKRWRFDLDQYPGMPAYLEIEGSSENHIRQALELLGLSGHKTSSEGERILIQKEYGLNWYNMRFK